MHLTGQLASISILGLPSKQSKFVVYLTSTPTENVMQEVHFVRFFPKRPHLIASFSALFSLTLIFFSLPLLVYLFPDSHSIGYFVPPTHIISPGLREQPDFIVGVVEVSGYCPNVTGRTSYATFGQRWGLSIFKSEFSLLCSSQSMCPY